MEIIRHVKERESLASTEHLKELKHSTVKEMNKIKTICKMPEIIPTICVVHVYFLALWELSLLFGFYTFNLNVYFREHTKYESAVSPIAKAAYVMCTGYWYCHKCLWSLEIALFTCPFMPGGGGKSSPLLLTLGFLLYFDGLPIPCPRLCE